MILDHHYLQPASQLIMTSHDCTQVVHLRRDLIPGLTPETEKRCVTEIQLQAQNKEKQEHFFHFEVSLFHIFRLFIGDGLIFHLC